MFKCKNCDTRSGRHPRLNGKGGGPASWECLGCGYHNPLRDVDIMEKFTINCMRTAKSDFHDIVDADKHIYNTEILIHVALGLPTEAGELVDPIKKSLFYGKPFDVVNVKEEAGDMLWYLAVLFEELGTSFEKETDRVIAKLSHRYPDKYTNEKALHRDLPTERLILETESLGQSPRKESCMLQAYQDDNKCIHVGPCESCPRIGKETLQTSPSVLQTCGAGHLFGVDCDIFDDCDKCKIWDECDEAMLR